MVVPSLCLALVVPCHALIPWAYDLRVIAQTGQAGLTTINNFVSINNRGLVAFRGITADGWGSLVADASGPRPVRPINANTMVQPNLQLNDNGMLVARRGPFFYSQTYPPFSETTDYLQTWLADGTGGLNLVVKGMSRWDGLTLGHYKVGPFCSAGLSVTINNAGQVAFLADQGDGVTIDYVLATATGSGGFNTRPCNGFVFPMLADDGHIVLRSGSAADSPIVLLNYDLTLRACFENG